MLKQTRHLVFLVRQLGLLLLLFAISRLFFYLFNYAYFSGSGITTLLSSLFWGMRFDTCAILFLNALYLLAFLLPFNYRYHPVFLRSANIFFILVNSLVLLPDCIDWVFFAFTQKRLTADFFDLFTMGNDIQNLLPEYFKQYWFILVIWAGMIFLLEKFTRKNSRKFLQQKQDKIQYVPQSIFALTALGLMVLGMRGGLQHRPIEVSTAIHYTSARNIPLFINTPFSILKSLQKKGQEELRYMDQKELPAYYDTRHKASTGPFIPKNVVIIILESFSKEYVGFLNKGKGYTPFLDSLMQHSLVFPNAYANAKRSIEGIPAIVAGIPAWMEQPYISSIYQSNEISTLASLLTGKGYSTSFFHGGATVAMNFDSFSKIAGFEYYYGRSEYPGNSDYDGNWGIFDEPFMQYFANRVNKQHSPFLATLFTLSSHHPYTIPAQYKDRFSKGTLEIHESIAYADHALKQYFETVKKMDWYRNTVFVITADHTSVAGSDFYRNRIGSYQVPLFYFMPGNELAAVDTTVTQHVDILPTLLGLLHFDRDYFAFGNDALDTSGLHFALNFMNNTYEYVEGSIASEFDGSQVRAEYDLRTDSLMQRNLVTGNIVSKQKENRIKAILQTYTNRVINNRLK